MFIFCICLHLLVEASEHIASDSELKCATFCLHLHNINQLIYIHFHGVGFYELVELCVKLLWIYHLFIQNKISFYFIGFQTFWGNEKSSFNQKKKKTRLNKPKLSHVRANTVFAYLRSESLLACVCIVYLA